MVSITPAKLLGFGKKKYSGVHLRVSTLKQPSFQKKKKKTRKVQRGHLRSGKRLGSFFTLLFPPFSTTSLPPQEWRGTMVAPMWLDCDPGYDDAVAMLLAAGSPLVKLLGVSTVSGNVNVEKTTRNAARVLTLCGAQYHNTTVLKGANRPLLAEPCHERVLKEGTGLDGSPVLDAFTADLTEKHTATLLETIQGMAHAIMNEPTPVDVVAVGAMTNIALLFRTVPEALKNVRQISIMGGALGAGNKTPCAEFNMYCDPEAASIVFNLPVKVVMSPLELTRTVRVTDEVQDSIKARLHNSNLSRVVLDLMTYYATVYNSFPSPPLHDPCAVMYCIAPELFTVKHYHVDVVTGGHLCAGQTVCQFRTEKTKNVHIATAVELDAFWEKMYDALERVNAVSGVNSFVAPS